MVESTAKTYGTWVLIGLTALAFAAAGSAKLAGVEMVHLSFKNMGLPVASGYTIGFFELAGAIGLFIRKFSALASAGLALIMIGAAGYHLVFDPLGASIPAFVLLAMTIAIFVIRRPDAVFTKTS